MLRLIAEIGSTHNGSFEECCNAIETAADTGVSDVKFQLLEKEHLGTGNILMPWEWLESLVKLGSSAGVSVYASCWSEEALRLAQGSGCKSVKFAYSARSKQDLIGAAVEMFDEVFVSTDFLHIENDGRINMLCTPHYPVEYLYDFSEMRKHFNAFSDHTLGIEQTVEAYKSGFTTIEKHINQCKSKITPDSRFAISWGEAKELIERCK